MLRCCCCNATMLLCCCAAVFSSRICELEAELMLRVGCCCCAAAAAALMLRCYDANLLLLCSPIYLIPHMLLLTADRKHSCEGEGRAERL